MQALGLQVDITLGVDLGGVHQIGATNNLAQHIASLVEIVYIQHYLLIYNLSAKIIIILETHLAKQSKIIAIMVRQNPL